MDMLSDEDEEWDDSDWDDATDDSEDEESTPTIECPHCGSDVYEDADQCPACGEFFVPDTNAWSGKPWWWAVLGLIGIVAVIVMLSGLFRGF